jgi:ComF family protein
VTPYAGRAKELVAMLKFSGAQAVARQMSALMAQLLNAVQTSGAVIVPVPTATGRVRRRGYDQARLLARGLARHTGLVALDCLARSGQMHQVGMRRERRLEQLQGAFRVRRPAAVHGRHVILVDDVVTTGATLEAAALALHDTGAGRVEAVTFCAA